MTDIWRTSALAIINHRLWIEPVVAHIQRELCAFQARHILASNPERDVASYVAVKLFLAEPRLAYMCQPFVELHDRMHDLDLMTIHAGILFRRIAFHVRSVAPDTLVRTALQRQFS